MVVIGLFLINPQFLALFPVVYQEGFHRSLFQAVFSPQFEQTAAVIYQVAVVAGPKRRCMGQGIDRFQYIGLSLRISADKYVQPGLGLVLQAVDITKLIGLQLFYPHNKSVAGPQRHQNIEVFLVSGVFDHGRPQSPG